MGSRRKHSVHAWRLAAFLVGAGLLAGCMPPPDQAPESPEPEVHKRERHHRHREEGAEAPRRQEENREEPSRRHGETRGEPSQSGESKNRVPEKVLVVLKYVEEHHDAPAGYEGGREFHNSSGQGEEPLPRRDNRGQSITYHEWDVNRKVAGVNRGAERLITGSDGSAYFTSDHYRTFTKIR